MPILNLILTTGCIVTMLLIAGLAVMDRRPSQSKMILILMMISLSGLMVDALPSELLPSRSVEAVAKFISTPNVGLIWWFALSVFDDKFQIKKIAWAGMIVSTSGPILFWLYYIGAIGSVPAAIGHATMAVALMLVCHTVWVGIASYRDDLIQPRREVRVWIVALVVLTLGVVLISQLTTSRDVTRLLRVGVVFPISILSLFWLTRFQSSILDFAPAPKANSENLSVTAKDQAAYQRLIMIMTEDKPYLDPDLSIGRLAANVGVPAHQLRTIINQGLGFRNFSTFLARYRIADIKPLLSDLENAKTPILTIALSNGFSSISTFNRAFKNEVGQTASQFRSHAFGGS